MSKSNNGLQAITDAPAFNFYKELLDAYPEAKVVLTVRDSPEVWHESFLETIQPFSSWIINRGSRSGLQGLLFDYFWPQDAFWRMSRLQVTHFMYPSIAELGPVFYQGYNDDIRRLVPKDRLLEFNVKEGWKPLCAFLGKDVPAKDFPRTNERLVIQQNSAFIRAGVEADIQKKIWKLVGVVGALTAAFAGVLYTTVF